MLDTLKRVLVGRPLASSEQDHQRISKKIALAVFSSDAISSTAYATEEILFVVALGTSSLLLGLDTLVPIAIAVGLLLTIVVFSYRQTIFAYPNGGGSYVVSRENLGKKASMLSGASLLVDYVLTVAVSISAGVAAIISIPRLQWLADHRVAMCLALVAFITLLNLRGMKESGRIFAFPTYLYILILSSLICTGLYQEFFGPGLEKVPFDKEAFDGTLYGGGTLGLLLILRGFSSGAVALTGIEAISDGVPAFAKPAAKNAAKTLVAMGAILGTLFFGVSVLAHHVQPYPSHDETAFSQMGRAVFGEGPLYLILQIATVCILTLAANTAYADFPRLSSIIARDGYLPRQLGNRGDRLVFSNGIIFLGVAASVLLIIFGGLTTALIPLYAVGVFTSFTVSQTAMVAHHRNHQEPGWRRNACINGLGAAATFCVLMVVAITKFTSGAWVSILVVGAVIGIFTLINRHYTRVTQVLSIEPHESRPVPINHTVIILVGRIHRGVLKALAYGKSLRPNHLAAVYISYEDGDAESIQQQWEDFGIDVPLEIVQSPYRELREPLTRYLDELEERWNDDTITVIIPEFVVKHWWENFLHNQSALQLKLLLARRRNTVVTAVPYHVKWGPRKQDAPD